MQPKDILDFWFHELEPKDWYKKSDALDATIVKRFAEVHRRANAGELFLWRETPAGRLAEIIVLDQFSRNMFRDSPRAFASDPLSLILCQEAISCGDDVKLANEERGILYLPLMHSESKIVHAFALKVFENLGSEGSLSYEKKHKAIIDRFGRYPHRNQALGRTSTEEERAFLAGPNSSF